MTTPHILFVDDDHAVLEGLHRSMGMVAPEWRVDVASSADTALTVLSSTIVDAVVSDLRMPGMDGDQLQREILLRFPWVIRIMLTGLADDAALVRGTQWSERYLTKPCSPHDLRREIADALQARENDRALVPRVAVGGLSSTPTVLCVDDNPGDAGLLAQALIDVDSGVTMEHAISGEQALDLLRTRIGTARPDVVLLDLSMPGMGGHEFLARYRSRGDELVPIIVVTGSTDPEDRRLAVSHGAAIALIKPETWDHYLDLARVISRFAKLVARRGEIAPPAGRTPP